MSSRSTQSSNAVTLLLVEDEQVDAVRVQRAIRDSKISNPILVAPSAEAALEMLRGEDPPACAKPYILLLDLSLPGMSGLDLLRELRQDPEHADVLAAVLTGSTEEADERMARELGVCAYIRKSRFAEDFIDALQQVNARWSLTTVASRE